MKKLFIEYLIALMNYLYELTGIEINEITFPVSKSIVETTKTYARYSKEKGLLCYKDGVESDYESVESYIKVGILLNAIAHHSINEVQKEMIQYWKEEKQNKQSEQQKPAESEATSENPVPSDTVPGEQ